MKNKGNDLEKLSKQDMLLIMKAQGDGIDKLRSEVGALRQELGLESEKYDDADSGIPETETIKKSYDKVSYRKKMVRSIAEIMGVLTVVAAATVLIAVLLLPVLRIYGQSMNTTLTSGELVVSVKGSSFDTGDIIAFYYNNNILVKRVIANSGDLVDMDMDGTVYVDQQPIDEPYLKDKAYGEPTIDFPYQVPEERVFVLGDNRSVSVDSRHSAVGCVTSEQIVGKVVFRVWPLSRFGPVK